MLKLLAWKIWNFYYLVTNDSNQLQNTDQVESGITENIPFCVVYLGAWYRRKKNWEWRAKAYRLRRILQWQAQYQKLRKETEVNMYIRAKVILTTPSIIFHTQSNKINLAHLHNIFRSDCPLEMDVHVGDLLWTWPGMTWRQEDLDTKPGNLCTCLQKTHSGFKISCL